MKVTSQKAKKKTVCSVTNQPINVGDWMNVAEDGQVFAIFRCAEDIKDASETFGGTFHLTYTPPKVHRIPLRERLSIYRQMSEAGILKGRTVEEAEKMIDNYIVNGGMPA